MGKRDMIVYFYILILFYQILQEILNVSHFNTGEGHEKV
jgi:hypothetical protein